MIIASALAEQDLFDIWFWGAGAHGADAADRFLDELDAEIASLANYPELGPARDDLLASLRSLSVNSYTVFYCTKGNDIEIVRVLRSERYVVAFEATH